jgi:hypothetical protein
MPVQSPLHTHCQLVGRSVVSSEKFRKRAVPESNSVKDRFAANASFVIWAHCPCPEQSFGHPANEQKRPWYPRAHWQTL